jgi:hypothetical protein
MPAPFDAINYLNLARTNRNQNLPQRHKGTKKCLSDIAICINSFCNYSGKALSTGATKRACNQYNNTTQPKQRVRSESAVGTGIDGFRSPSIPARLVLKRSG